MQVVGGERDLAVAGAIGAHLPQQQVGGVGEDGLFAGGLGLFDSVMVDALGERAVTFHDQPADGEQVAGQAVVLDLGARCGDDVADDGRDQLPATLVPDGGVALVDLAEGVGDAAGLLDQPGVVRAQCGERIEVGAELVELRRQVDAARVEDVDLLTQAVAVGVAGAAAGGGGDHGLALRVDGDERAGPEHLVVDQEGATLAGAGLGAEEDVAVVLVADGTRWVVRAAAEPDGALAVGVALGDVRGVGPAGATEGAAAGAVVLGHRVVGVHGAAA
jgi:hypothetical protein